MPTTNHDARELTFGIEIETTVRPGTVRVGGYRVGTQVEWLPAGWKSHSDCSIRSTHGRVGCEFVSPVLKGEAGIAQVIEVLDSINARGIRVNETCGVHVHVGWTGNDKSLKRLVTLVANFETAIYATTGTKSRERGRWCGGLQRYGNSDSAQNGSQRVRYHVLNLTNLGVSRKNTVEFRAFSGTTSIVKILGYIRLCLGLVERAHKAKRVTNFTAKVVSQSSPIKRGGQGQTTLTRLFYQLGWIKGRTNHTYGDVTTQHAPSLAAIKKEFMRLAKKYDAQD